MELLFKRLNEKAAKAEKILLLSHRRPDPDTVGGALALGAFLRRRGKKVSYFCADKIPQNFFFMPGAEKFTDDKNLLLEHHDLSIFVDCGDLGRAGMYGSPDDKKNFWVKIDHHLTAEPFFDIEIREPSYGATCEIIYEFLNYAKDAISPQIATALLAGLLVDTGFLSNEATNERSINIAAKLLSAGADYGAALANFHANKNINTLKLWGLGLSRLKHNVETGIATTVFWRDDLARPETEEALAGISGFLAATLPADAIAVYFETDGGVRGSLRTTRGGLNAAELAKKYGGGGHERAAGFTCRGKIIERENEWGVEKS